METTTRRRQAVLALLLISVLLPDIGSCDDAAQQGTMDREASGSAPRNRIGHGDSARKFLQEQQNRYWGGHYENKASWWPGLQGQQPQFPQWPPWPWTPEATPPMSFPPSPAPAPSPAAAAAVSEPQPLPRHAHSIASPPHPAAAGAGAGGSPASVAAHGAGRSGAVGRPVYAIAAAGASLLAAASVALLVLCYRSSKVVTVRPWATGLSGQLQKAFVTGVPSLKRSELELACEDFSNVIGSLPGYMVYKGTLSSGVEIAVVSTTRASPKDWSKHCEAHFRTKITSLSRVNHKNFVNLLGYCQEEQPFTRMMVFEYAPNGTLFEHLHVREDGHLDWATRLRVAVGVAYCLEHMHQLTPPEVLRALDASTVCLTDDFAAKISDVFFCEEEEEEEPRRGGNAAALAGREGVVYSYGLLLLELVAGRRAASAGGALLEGWAAAYLRGERQLRDVVDPALRRGFDAATVDMLDGVVRGCTDRDPRRRMTMAEVAKRLREITAMPPDAATPKVSPLWWAELEIISTEVN